MAGIWEKWAATVGQVSKSNKKFFVNITQISLSVEPSKCSRQNPNDI